MVFNNGTDYAITISNKILPQQRRNILMKFQFIEPELSTPDLKSNQPASYLRKTFVVKDVSSAILHMTALGVYKVFVNGQELDNGLLYPGFTNYNKRVQYQTYDIEPYLKNGENVIATILGEGWYRGCCGAGNTKGFYGNKIKLAAILDLEDSQGQRQIITDESWKATQEGPIRENDIKTYETVDMTKDLGEWQFPYYDDNSWNSVFLGHYAGDCIPHEGEKVLEHETFSPKVLVTPNGETVLDFGQNHAGHVGFTVTGKAGQTVKLVMGEVLDEDCNFTQKNVSQTEGAEDIIGDLGQTLTYTLAEGTQFYKSLFLISGYRYVKLENWPEIVRPENFISYAVYSDVKEIGHFTSSSEKLNQLVSNVLWSQKSNFVEIPTDCPTRERAGWTGDINVFSETAIWFTDNKKFLYKWLRDFVLTQKENGSLPFIVPEMDMDIIPNVNMNELPYSSAGWSDALVHIPMIIYRFTGDTEGIKIVYEAAKKFADFNLERAKEKHPDNVNRTEDYFDYILDTGFHWGEWAEPGTVMFSDLMNAMTHPDAEVATAWFFNTLQEVSWMAEILGKDDDKYYYIEKAELVREAYLKEFTDNGKVSSDRQCKYVRPVMMGLTDKSQSQQLMAELNEKIIANDYKIGTGFLTTFRILHSLAEYGYADTAYRVLFNEKSPGWMYEISKGATTTWELWTGIGEDNVPHDSMNHYSPGAAISFVFEYISGIKPLEPGFDKVQIKPEVHEFLDYATATYQSPHGLIKSHWERTSDGYQFELETPEGIETQVVLPNGNIHEFTGGDMQFSI